jgi:hypothetical protein
MPKKEEKQSPSKPEKISGQEALRRMKKFGERKEKIIASIIASKN